MGLSSSKDSWQQKQLLHLIELNADGQLDQFLRANPEFVNAKLCNSSTNGMCRATYLGYKNCVVVLLKYGADVNHCS